MVYIGITLYMEEALRILNMNGTFVKSFYDTKPIDDFLKDIGSCLSFRYLDKGVCVLGIPLEGDRMYWPSMICVEDGLSQILQLTKKFREEVRCLKIDLSSVTIAQMESEALQMQNPDPFLILCS